MEKPVDIGIPKYYNTKTLRLYRGATDFVCKMIFQIRKENGGLTYVHFYGQQGEHRA